MGAVGDHGRLAGHARELSVRPRGLLRHARAQRLRRFPQADPGRHAAPDDGRVSLDARQPEAERASSTSAPTRTMRASSCSCSRSAWSSSTPTAASKRDAQNQPIPTYDQAVDRRVRARLHRLEMGVRRRFAANLQLQQHARDSCRTRSCRCRRSPSSTTPARSGCSRTRARRRASIPAGQTPAQDLADALDNIVNHPNVGPFISRAADPATRRRAILRLSTSRA